MVVVSVHSSKTLTKTVFKVIDFGKKKKYNLFLLFIRKNNPVITKYHRHLVGKKKINKVLGHGEVGTPWPDS